MVTKLYADDTCLLFSANSDADLQIIANTELSKIENWLISNELTLNHNKTKCMVINKSNKISVINIHINGIQVDQVKLINYLDLRIDSNLKWRNHLIKLESKLSQSCAIISKLQHYVNFDCLKKFFCYFAKVYSYLQYAILAWGGSNQSELHRLNVLHNNIVRLMALKNSLPDVRQLLNITLYKTINLLQLKDIYNLELAKFMYKAHHQTLPHCLNSMFTRIDIVHWYPTSASRNTHY